RACAVHARCLVVAIDGRSGAGKSTVAALVGQGIEAVIVPCDDFFAASVSDADWDRRTPEQRAADAIDWRRLRREAIEPLRNGRAARWYAFDFLAGPRGDGTYPLQRTPTERAPKPVVLLDGAYSSRPELDATSLLPFVPSGKDYETSRRLFAELGFEEVWESGGYAGFRNGGAEFILQRFDDERFAANFMVRLNVDDLTAWWETILGKG